MGVQNRVVGYYGYALGQNNYVNDYAEIAVGMFNTVGTGSTSSFVATDRIFSVGNGTDALNRSNALTIYKNGAATLQ